MSGKDYPGQFGNSPMYGNPNVTLPMPMPTEMPQALWEATDINLTWVNQGGTSYGGPTQLPDVYGPGLDVWAGGKFLAQWTSPVFDLRPDLRSGQGGPKNGVPIWRIGAKLYLQIRQLTAAANASAPGGTIRAPGLRVFGYEYMSTTFAYINSPSITVGGDPPGAGPYTSVLLSTTNIDVGGQIIQPAGQPESIVLRIAPPGTESGTGAGDPIRYWRFKIVFDQRTTVASSGGEDPTYTPATPLALTLQAAVY